MPAAAGSSKASAAAIAPNPNTRCGQAGTKRQVSSHQKNATSASAGASSGRAAQAKAAGALPATTAASTPMPMQSSQKGTIRYSAGSTNRIERANGGPTRNNPSASPIAPARPSRGADANSSTAKPA